MMLLRGSALAWISMVLMSCESKTGSTVSAAAQNDMAGTWQLIKGTVIENRDTVVTDYTKNISFIKIINNTHFAFLQHDLKKGKDTAAVFVAGGGRYSVTDSFYTEHLEYCSDRAWEGNDFKFTVTIKNDTLTQSGMEKIESTGVSRLNTETYVRVKN